MAAVEAVVMAEEAAIIRVITREGTTKVGMVARTMVVGIKTETGGLVKATKTINRAEMIHIVAAVTAQPSLAGIGMSSTYTKSKSIGRMCPIAGGMKLRAVIAFD